MRPLGLRATCWGLRRTVALLVFSGALLSLTGGSAHSSAAEVVVDFSQPSSGVAQTVRFELGSNELFDLYIDGGIERSRQLGLDRIRIWLGHRFLGASVRSTQPFDFDWDLLYAFVERVLEAAATPHLSFVAAPAWVPAFDGRPSSQHESEGFDDEGARAYGEYVAETIERLRARFGEQALDWPYVIWNEPNNHQNAGLRYACGDGAAYVALYRAARLATDERFGLGRIQLGGPSLDGIDTGATLDGDGEPRCGATPDWDWETYLRSVDAGADFDFITWHWYGMFLIDETPPQDVLLTRLVWFEDRVWRVSQIAAGRPHYVEEINLNGDLAADPLIYQQVNAAFMASATLRAIRQGASGLVVYKGTRHPSGLSPRGEPDFGLWTSDGGEAPTPAFYALRLLRRFVVDGSRLARTDCQASDLDALALEGPTGRTLAVVNLLDAAREVRIEGIAAGPYVYTDATTSWGTGWFDGQQLSLRAHAVAVITSEALGLTPLPSVARGRQAFQSAAGGAECVSATALDSSQSAGLTACERSDLAAYLRGLETPPHSFTGVVSDTAGAPIEGAFVLATSGNTARISITGSDGRFSLPAPRGEAVPEAAPPQFTVVHPAYRAAFAPARALAIEPGVTDLAFELEPLAGQWRPMIAVPHVAPSGTPGQWTVGVATAGDDLQVWALDETAEIALRLARVEGHPYGLHQALHCTTDGPADEHSWRTVAIGADGVPSLVVRLKPATQAAE